MNTYQIPQAVKRVSDREVTYTWRNETLDKTYHEANDAGEQIALTISHNAKRKQYEATLSVSWWQPTTATGFRITIWAPFDHVTYPSASVLITPVARYGDKSFAQFEKDALAVLGVVDTESAVGQLLNRIQSYDIKK
jgi:hypothetical protein